MTNFTLGIEFNPADLKTIALAGELVTIVNLVPTVVTSAMPTAKLAAEAAPNEIVWLAFSPLENNVVRWTDDYDVYASYTTEVNGVITSTQTNAPAQATKIIPFNGDVGFGKPLEGTALPAGVYGVANEYRGVPYYTFGMATRTLPVINGKSVEAPKILRMNAAIVPTHHNAQFTPANSLQVFLQSSTSSGMQLPNSIRVPPLQFSASKTEIVIKYNAQTASFDVVH